MVEINHVGRWDGCGWEARVGLGMRLKWGVVEVNEGRDAWRTFRLVF